MSHPWSTRLVIRRGHSLAAIALTSGLLLGNGGPAAANPLDAFVGPLDFGSSLLDPSAPERPGQLQSVDNFRDVAGIVGYGTEDGGSMTRGVFYRSNQLVRPAADDQAELDAMGLSTVYDLRTDADIALPFVGGQDTVPAGAAYRHLPIDSGNFIEDAQALHSPEDAEQYMRDMYRGFVTDAASRSAFGELLTEMAVSTGPEVYHCTSGKDRTGWASMLLQHVAGVSDEIIMNDYLLTNEYSAGSIESTLAQIGNVPGIDADNIRPMLIVDESYLEAGRAQVIQNYGDIDRYLTVGLGLDDITLSQLENKLAS